MAEKGKRKWIRIININLYVHIYSACYIRVLMRLKKEARQVNKNSPNLKRRNIGIVNMQDRDPGWLSYNYSS